jgi:DNA invertase Pin-like site-specific DNA recombinase
MSGVFPEFERAMIVERVKAGLRRAQAEGTKLGRPRVNAEIEGKMREQLALGLGIHRVAKLVGCGRGQSSGCGRVPSLRVPSLDDVRGDRHSPRYVDGDEAA